VAVWLDPDRVLARVEGPRAGAALNGLLSADLEALEPGEAVLSFVLTARGRPVAVPRVVRLPQSFLLDLSRRALPGLLDHFGTYLPPRLASVKLLDEARRVSLLGPGAAALTAGLTLGEEVARVYRPPEDGGGVDLYLPDGSALPSIEIAALGAGGSPATPDDYDTWRIEHGIPRFGVDVTADHLPQETGLVARAVSFQKGCYTGQEVVARIHYRGHVNRHLRGIRSLDPPSAAGLSPGLELSLDGRPVGSVTSACSSPRFGAIALGYVRREVSPGTIVQASSTPPLNCFVTELPFTST